MEDDLIHYFQSSSQPLGFTPQAVQGTTSNSVRSLLDAIRISEENRYGYLVYGFVRIQDLSYSLELKLYDAEKREVSEYFFSSDSLDRYERLIQSVGHNIAHYFNETLGFVPETGSSGLRNRVQMPISLGYYAYVDPRWGSYTVGVGRGRLGVRFIPADPLFSLFKRRALFRFGLDVGYSLGLSQPDYESSVLHTISFDIPIELILDIGGTRGTHIFSRGVHIAGLAVSPGLFVDILVQDRKYAEVVSTSSLSSGGSLAVLYAYAVSDHVSLGLSNALSIIAYKPIQVKYSPSFTLNISFGKGDNHLEADK